MSVKDKDTALKLADTKVSINRFSGGRTGFNIEITCPLSGCRIVDVEMTLEEFARCIGSQGVGNATLYRSPHHGLVREYKTVVAPLPQDEHHARNLSAMYDAIEAEHVGWRASRDERVNYHRLKGDMYEVGLIRYVEPQP